MAGGLRTTGHCLCGASEVLCVQAVSYEPLVSCLVDSLAVAADAVEDLLGGLGPDVRAGVSFQVSIHWRISLFIARTERCAPRRRSLVVSSPTQRSTRLIHELDVGVKCK